MHYHSTRSDKEQIDSKEAVLKGLAPDGGLYVTDGLDNIRFDTDRLIREDYNGIASAVLKAFLDDYSENEISEAVKKAYTGKFDTDPVTPLTEIGDDRLLELYHGPTAAFKDMALCMLPQLMSLALGEKDKKVMILTATSGDTGKAALEGFKNTDRIGICVFYPHGGVSDIQYLQMAAQEGSNVSTAAVRGNFDDCQTAVKAVFERSGAEIFNNTGVMLSSANSINIGRLVPQIVYYIFAYKKLIENGSAETGEKVDFVVPTGNFGDVLAGYFAKRAGLPVGRLIVASNDNRVLTDFLETGVYDRRRKFVKTISPSMDILVSSNLERLIYYESGCDCEYTASLMRDLKEKGRFEASGSLMSNIRQSFDCGCAYNEDAKEALRIAYHNCGRLIDPHTAVAYSVRNRMRSDTERNTVILSTASPFKFSEDVYKALFGTEHTFNDGFGYMDALSEKTGVCAPYSLSSLRTKPILHRSVLDKEEIGSFAVKEIGRLFNE